MLLISIAWLYINDTSTYVKYTFYLLAFLWSDSVISYRHWFLGDRLYKWLSYSRETERRLLNFESQAAEKLRLLGGDMSTWAIFGGGGSLRSPIFSERQLTFTFAICCPRPSVVCQSVRLSITFVHPTQAVVIFRNISTVLGTLAIRWHPRKISRRSSQGNPFATGVKHKRGSQV